MGVVVDKYGNQYATTPTPGNAGSRSGRRPSTPERASAGRVSQGAGQVLLGKGGLGYIARRGVDFGTSVAVQTLEGVARLAIQQPLELLSLLPDLVPEVSLALWNGTFLGCGPDSIRIKAMKPNASGGSEEAPDGTAAIQNMWENNSPEVGNLIDALAQNYQMLMFSGMCAAEAVPGRRMKGVVGVFPVNTLTLRYKREDNGELKLYQRQTSNPNGLGLYSAGFGGLFEPMPMDRFFHTWLSSLPDEPYGRAPFGAALTTVLECLAFMRDVMTAFHRVGTPKWDVGFDFEMWHNIAKNVIGLSDPKEISDYVQTKYADAVHFFHTLQPDDVFFHDLKSVVHAVGSGDSWPDVQGLWSMLRLRLVQAVKQVPTLMGISENASDTWSRVEWDIYASALKTLVYKAALPLVRASSLHLRLLGMPYVAELEMAPIKSITALIDAQSAKIEIDNEARKRDEGWQSQETAAMKMTGSGPVTSPPRPPSPKRRGGRLADRKPDPVTE
jgi:hypothetical protein